LSKSSKPKILLLDIETIPGKAYIWNMWDDRVPLERLIEPGRSVCAALKWHREKGITFVAEWNVGRKAMLQTVRDMMAEADAVVTFNGDKFDFQVLEGEFISEGIKPAPPITSIDLYKKVRGLRYMSGKMEYVLPYLDIGTKMKTGGFSLWRGVMAGDPKAQARMELYNKQDTRKLGPLYERLKPYMKNHPHLREGKPQACPVCGDDHVQHRGYRRTRTMRVERLQCQSATCGAWFTGKQSKIK
jgi:hypothetical protein